MKILHFCLSCFYIDNRLYQENELVREHVLAGHDVLVVASTEVFDDNGNLTYVEPIEYIGSEGARVVRLHYRCWLPHIIGRKVRCYPGILRILNNYRPNVVIFHGSGSFELITVSRFIRENPDVEFYVDSHADSINSGSTMLSLELLHRRFYGPILRHALKFAHPLLSISSLATEFAHSVYGIPLSRIQYFPLGGRILSLRELKSRRFAVRTRLSLSDDNILIIQTGKQSKSKKILESLRAFSQVRKHNLRFLIAGSLHPEVESECSAIINSDSRIIFLGWVEPEYLTDLLCAADVYLQPGSQSATMQHSICCGCAVILSDIPSHVPYADGCGWLVSCEADIMDLIKSLNVKDLAKVKSRSLRFARQNLDYKKLASSLVLGSNNDSGQ